MDRPERYTKCNDLQKNDAEYVLDNYLRLIKWNKSEDESILDIGCGDGEVLLEILLPKLPRDFKQLVGVDISEKFVKFAKSRTKSTKIEFQTLDIATDLLPIKFQKNFDHIFSFYCLHWVIDQRQAMKNIFTMLKPGGDILLTFLASNPIYDIYEILSKSSRWSLYMKDVNKFISPYHHSKDPETEMEKLLKSEGFTSLACRIETRTFTFSNFAKLAKAIESVNPFINRIPKDETENYINDYVKEAKKSSKVIIESINNNKNDEKIHFDYKLFVVLASKPVK